MTYVILIEDFHHGISQVFAVSFFLFFPTTYVRPWQRPGPQTILLVSEGQVSLHLTYKKDSDILKYFHPLWVASYKADSYILRFVRDLYKYVEISMFQCFKGPYTLHRVSPILDSSLFIYIILLVKSKGCFFSLSFHMLLCHLIK